MKLEKEAQFRLTIEVRCKQSREVVTYELSNTLGKAFCTFNGGYEADGAESDFSKLWLFIVNISANVFSIVVFVRHCAGDKACSILRPCPVNKAHP